MSKPKHAVIDRTESFMQSLFADIVTFSLLAFCIWISLGSTWWTFLTGMMFLLFAFGKLSVVFGQRCKKFTTKQELIDWANGLDWEDHGSSQ